MDAPDACFSDLVVEMFQVNQITASLFVLNLKVSRVQPSQSPIDLSLTFYRLKKIQLNQTLSSGTIPGGFFACIVDGLAAKSILRGQEFISAAIEGVGDAESSQRRLQFHSVDLFIRSGRLCARRSIRLHLAALSAVFLYQPDTFSFQFSPKFE